eukprot:6726155-Prymnesium_polylepis.1
MALADRLAGGCCCFSCCGVPAVRQTRALGSTARARALRATCDGAGCEHVPRLEGWGVRVEGVGVCGCGRG